MNMFVCVSDMHAMNKRERGGVDKYADFDNEMGSQGRRVWL